MMTKAVIVNNDYVAFSNSVPMIHGDTPMIMDAILMTLVKAQKEDIVHGALYCNEAPCFSTAQAIIAAELCKVVYQEEELNEDQLAAKDLMEQYGIVVIRNPNLIL